MLNMRHHHPLILLIPTLFLLTSHAFAADYKVIDTAGLKAMIDSGQSFTLVDARTPDEYSEAHIGKAVNVTEKNFDKESAQLPADMSELVVFYCNGLKCGKSKKVAAKAEAAGYTNLMLYGEGFPVWEEKGLSVIAGPDYGKKIETTKIKADEMKKIVDNGSQEFVIVDVRDENEFSEGHVPSAINIPTETFATKSEVLPKEKKIVVYCNTGGRSYTAYRKLIKLAYPNIYQTTLAEWKDAGYPVSK